MDQKTKIYEYNPGSSKLIKTIDGVLIPYMPKGGSIEVDDNSYMVKSYGIIVEGDTIIAVIDVE